LNLAQASVVLMTFFASLLGSGAVRYFAVRSKLLDIPNTRSSHAAPTPRGGGLAIVLAFYAATLMLVSIGLLDRTAMLALAAGAAVAWVGFLDDRRQLSAKSRFTVHLAAAISVIAVLGAIPMPLFSWLGVGEHWISAILMVFVLAWATNLFNFMDGIDGLAAVQAIFMAAAGAILNSMNGGDTGLSAAAACVSAATLGFLVWNWPPARLFMGDVGSGFLGFILAALAFAMNQRGGVPMAVWAILGGLFLVDASLTLIRRMVRGDRWSEPHRTHAYQHLARRWHAHLPVTLLTCAINAAWLLPWAWYAARYPPQANWCVAIALLPLVVLAFLSGAGVPERVP
jgi:Fuc2NAc and GlcNAc transferase